MHLNKNELLELKVKLLRNRIKYWQIGARFGVTRQAVSNILNGRYCQSETANKILTYIRDLPEDQKEVA
jgi:DNA-binding XRE family transcriptional regulator